MVKGRKFLGGWRICKRGREGSRPRDPSVFTAREDARPPTPWDRHTPLRPYADTPIRLLRRRRSLFLTFVFLFSSGLRSLSLRASTSIFAVLGLRGVIFLLYRLTLWRAFFFRFVLLRRRLFFSRGFALRRALFLKRVFFHRLFSFGRLGLRGTLFFRCVRYLGCPFFFLQRLTFRRTFFFWREIGRASCRERVCSTV